MTQVVGGLNAPAPPRIGSARGLIRWVCTSNPFYVLSAGLFLGGLWISFGQQTQVEETWALMSGLAGYTLLLAVTACLLVRFLNVWDDVRTVLLLVVLMFLATSVTFDAILASRPALGFVCFLGGLLFAIVVSEGVLRGIRLALPPWFRVSYYVILGLFFLYPLALSPLLGQSRSEALMWGIFGFSLAAGLAFLTLLPAIRRGPSYVHDNGSPWPWPLYPWSLFVFLGLAVPGRAVLLCWSMHLLDARDQNFLIFGPYFLVPFGLALAALLLEMGLVSNHRAVLGTALALPLGLVALALVGHRPDPIYQAFLETFTARLGGDPLFVTMLAVTGFYGYAVLRRVPSAAEALTAALAALAFIGPDSLKEGALTSPEPISIVAAGALQLGLGLWRRASWRCLLGASGLALAITLILPAEAAASPYRDLIAFHLVLLAVLIVGAVYDDAFARLLRSAAPTLVLLTCLTAIIGRFDNLPGVPSWTVMIYPLVMSAVLAGYGLVVGHRPTLAVAGLVLVCWFVATAWRGYSLLRQLVTGLDYLALSLALFALAIAVSLAKSGLLTRWLWARRHKAPPSVD